MNRDELKRGFVALNELAEIEYHQSLQQLLGSPSAEPGKSDPTLQIGRLIGVVLKEPFAEPLDLKTPSAHSGAYRSWELVDEPAFKVQRRLDSWQYQVLQHLTDENGLTAPYQLALEAHHERGFFGYLARSTAKYICGDPKIRKEIEKSLDVAKKSGVNVSVTSPDLMVGSAGFSLGMLLIAHVPVLGFVGAPVIAGFVLIIYRIGLDAFCAWSNDYRTNVPMERI